MRYTSTRSCSSTTTLNGVDDKKDLHGKEEQECQEEEEEDKDYSFWEALTMGYAPDGGLFVPKTIPILPPLSKLIALSYSELLYTVLRMFISSSELPDSNLKTICQSTILGFATTDATLVPVVPLIQAQDDPNNNNDTNPNNNSSNPSSSCNNNNSNRNHGKNTFFISELFHGPTYCFKDLGMRVVLGLMSYYATQQQQNITLLVSTTGDTGPAALQAVADLDNPRLKIVVHYPDGQISNLQRRQLTTIVSDRVRVVSFEGGGDDMDQPIKNLMLEKQQQQQQLPHASQDFETTQSKSLWTGINSYNIGRPLAQTIIYIWTYLRIAEQRQWDLSLPSTMLPTIDYIVPTGAMGNVVAGYMAQQMGLPVRRFITAVNVNDITHSAIQTGVFHRRPAMIKTLSDAMNIQVPYNFERLLYYLTDGNSKLVKDWYDGMTATSKIDLGCDWLSKLQETFSSARVTDEQMCAALQQVYHQCQYLADPHTAVGLSAAQQLGYWPCGAEHCTDQDNSHCVTALLATASPCKFEHAVSVAVGDVAWQQYRDSSLFPSSAKALMERPERQPLHYEAVVVGNHNSLIETQKRWEQLLRNVIAVLEGESNSI